MWSTLRETSYCVAPAEAVQVTFTAVVEVAVARTLVGAVIAAQPVVTMRWLVMPHPFALVIATVSVTLGLVGVKVIDAVFVALVMLPPAIDQAYVAPVPALVTDAVRPAVQVTVW